ncbi:MAG: hypothetical protein AAF307_03330 [Pseudomonadota bacterium]
MSDGLPFAFRRQGRSLRTALTVALIWAALIFAWVALDAALWILGFLALFTLPALWDLAANPPSGLTVTRDGIRWQTGARQGEVSWEEVDHVRFDTRLDFSVRMTLILGTGAKVRLPFEATPPDKPLEALLATLDVPTKRFHFQLLQ